MRTFVFFATLSALASTAYAHKPSDSYLRIARTDDGAAVEWDVALYDLELALALDGDRSGDLTFSEVLDARARIIQAARSRVILRSEQGRCELRDATSELALVSHSDGPYLRLPLTYRCPDRGRLTLAYSFLFDVDAQHRAIVRHGSGTSVLRRGHGELSLGGEESFYGLMREGTHHIFAGVDHLAFLLALMLPLWLRAARARSEIRVVLGDVVKVVTAFTLAHSLTLSLAVFGAVRVAASVVEPAIAATITIAAFANLREHNASRAPLAFALGLLHGFGFSSALADLGLAGPLLARALLAFNLGVEAGQLAVVFGLLAAGSLLARIAPSPRFVVRGGSLALLAISVFWLIERLQGG